MQVLLTQFKAELGNFNKIVHIFIYCFCKQWYIFKDMQVSTYSILQIYNLMSLETNNCIQQDQ